MVRSIGSMTVKIAVLSQKGGTGKTTTVRTLTDVLRRCGVSTLAVDLDPQGNLSEYFDLPPDVEPTIAEVLTGGSSAAEAVSEDIIPANLSLAEAELMLGGKMGRELTLRRALAKGLDAYDVILIDCPPSLGLLTVNALVAADRALITAEAQYFALQGVEQAMEVVELARENLNPDLELLGILLNLADMRTVHSREALMSLKERFGEQRLRHRHPRLDRLRRVGRAGPLDPRPPPRPRRRLHGAGGGTAGAPARAGGRPRARRRARSELPDVGPLGLEGGAHQLRPALDLPLPGRRRPCPSARRSTTPAPSARRPRWWHRAPRARGPGRRARTSAGTGASGAPGGGGPAAPGTADPSPRGRGRRDSRAAWATLKTACPIGTSSGSAARAARVRTGSVGTTARASSPVGGSSLATCPSATITKPPWRAAATLSG